MRSAPLDQVTSTALSRPIHVCYGVRGWLAGYEEIGDYIGLRTQGKRRRHGSVARTIRRMEGLYKMPIHRLPDRVPRAIPFELDMWLQEFSKLWKEERAANPPSTYSPITKDYRAGKGHADDADAIEALGQDSP